MINLRKEGVILSPTYLTLIGSPNPAWVMCKLTAYLANVFIPTANGTL